MSIWRIKFPKYSLRLFAARICSRYYLHNVVITTVSSHTLGTYCMRVCIFERGCTHAMWGPKVTTNHHGRASTAEKRYLIGGGLASMHNDWNDWSGLNISNTPSVYIYRTIDDVLMSQAHFCERTDGRLVRIRSLRTFIRLIQIVTHIYASICHDANPLRNTRRIIVSCRCERFTLRLIAPSHHAESSN